MYSSMCVQTIEVGSLAVLLQPLPPRSPEEHLLQQLVLQCCSEGAERLVQEEPGRVRQVLLQAQDRWVALSRGRGLGRLCAEAEDSGRLAC